MLKTLVRRVGLVLASLVVVLVLAAAGGLAATNHRLNRTFDVPAERIAVAHDAATVERGRHLATAIGKCVACHGDNFAGKVLVDDPAFGRFVSANLTSGRGGVGGQLSAADWERAIRHGVAPSGRPLVFMPSQDFRVMGDEDVGALIAYLQQLPPVDNALPATQPGPLARALLIAGRLPPLPAEVIAADARRGQRDAGHAPAPAPGPSVAYGRYLTSVGGCTGCHGSTLSGGPIPGEAPDARPAANLTPEGIGHWSEADFRRALREGRRPDGTRIAGAMPWNLTRLMTDEEISAVYAYLRTVPRKGFGSR
jgi:mono/diheme cytochrome c family protein